MALLTLTPVAPIGKIDAHTFHGRLSFDRYPETREMRALKALRRTQDMGPTDAAIRLGITTSELLGLEEGRYACDWAVAMRLLSPEL